jgi:hypothetical protein
MVLSVAAFKSYHLFGSGSDPKRCRSPDIEGVVEMNSYHRRTYQFIQLKIPFGVWAVVALAMGVFIALLIVLASIDV